MAAVLDPETRKFLEAPHAAVLATVSARGWVIRVDEASGARDIDRLSVSGMGRA